MKCNNCGYEDSIPFSSVKCFYSKEPLSVVKCLKCQLVYLNPRPDKSKGLEYFEKAYSNSEGFENHSYYRDHDQIFSRNKTRFDSIKRLAVPNKKILDFGAGQGHFVKTAIDNGWSANGIELSEAAIHAARANFSVKILDSLELLEDNDYGVITLWDVIEHLENPKETLIEVSKYLHPKGYFIIETSNIDSLDYLVHKKNWSYWHIDHLFYYSRKSIIYLLNTLGFFQIKNQSSSEFSRKATINLFDKYKTLLNPRNFILTLQKKWLSYRYKGYDRNSLMTIIFQRKE